MTRWVCGWIICCINVWAPSAWATTYDLPTDGSALIGTDEHLKSRREDTLLDIAHRYSLGYEEIIRANPHVDMWLPGEGTDILLPGRRILPPGPREGLVVNLPEHRLYYYPRPKRGGKPVGSLISQTLVPTGTSLNRAATSSGYIRMQPCVTAIPTARGLLVP